MTKSFRYTLLGFLLFTITISCKAEEFYRDCWNKNECIQGGWINNAYWKLTITQWYYKNNEWNNKLLFYSKYAYAFDYNEEEDKDGNKSIEISFLNIDDYIKTKFAWQKELPNYVLKRIYFYDKFLRIEFLKWLNKDACEERKNTHEIQFYKTGNLGLERNLQNFPNAKELSR